MTEWLQDCLSPEGEKRGEQCLEEDLSTVIFDSYDDQRLMGTLVGHSRRRERVFDTRTSRGCHRDGTYGLTE